MRASRRRVLAAAGPLVAGPLGAAGAACGLPGQAPPAGAAGAGRPDLHHVVGAARRAGARHREGAPGVPGEAPARPGARRGAHRHGRAADGEGADDGRRRHAAGPLPPAPAGLPGRLRPEGAAPPGRRPAAARPARRPRRLHPRAAGARGVAGQALGPPGGGVVPGHPVQPHAARPGRPGGAGGRWTWDAWLDAARRVAALPAPDGARTFGADDLAMWEVLVWAWGGEILNKPETECVLNRPPAPEALQWRADLLNRHGAVPAPADLTGVQNGARGPLRAGADGDVHGRELGPGGRADGGPDGLERGPVPAGRAGRWTLAGGAMYGALGTGGRWTPPGTCWPTWSWATRPG